MPTFTGRVVKVASYKLHTSMTLAEIRAKLANARPVARRSPGWGSSHDDTVVLGQAGSTGTGRASIEPVHGDVPEKIAARYFSWEFDPVDDQGELVDRNWVLDATDILISSSGTNSYLVLFSTWDSRLIDPQDGVVSASLLDQLRDSDPTVSLSDPTALTFTSADVFLWLAQQAETEEPLRGAITVDSLSRVRAEEDEEADLSATLRGDVDMQRATFLTAVAEDSPLGPAVISISEPNADGRMERVTARVWRDGAFQVLVSATRLRDIVDGELVRLEAVYRLAYRYLPLINEAYGADEDWGEFERDWLVIEKRLKLAERYQKLAEGHDRWEEYQAAVALD